MRGGKFSVSEPLSLQTVLVAGAGVDIPFFPVEKPVIDRGYFVDPLDSCATHTPGYFGTSHVLLPVLGDRQHEH